MSEDATIQRLGVLGGTFDPPHYGHLVLADTARVQLRLDLVLFVPAGQPPHKPETQPSPVSHRIALLRAALSDAGESAFRLSHVDVERPGPHYTVDTLEILRQRYPEAQIWFLVGGDSLKDLPTWRQPQRIVEMARLGVLPRVGYEPEPTALAEELCGDGSARLKLDLRERIDWLVGPAVDISSSALRFRARQRFPLRYLVPPSIEDYVREHRLYENE